VYYVSSLKFLMHIAEGQPARKSITLGIFLTIIAGSAMALMDGISKHLTGFFDPIQVIWSRYFFHALIVIVYLLTTQSCDIFKTKRPKMQLQRSFALFAATFAMYTSLKYLPLADASAMQHMAPVLVTFISGIFLGERIGIRRYFAVIAAFCGVLIIAQPGTDFKWAILLPMFTATMLSIFLIQTRALQGHDNAYTTLFYSTLVGVIVMIVLVPFFWRLPNVYEFLLMCAQGSLGAIGHLALIKGFKYATASVLSPFLYSQFLVSLMLSVTLFADPLTTAIGIGGSLIVASGIYIWKREGSLAKHQY
jgi:drug/metabolite transporter (DMT)-like permease